MKYEKEAAKLLAAIKRIAANEYGAGALESYLTQHFPVWLERYANTPGGVVVRVVALFIFRGGWYMVLFLAAFAACPLAFVFIFLFILIWEVRK